MEPFLKLPKRNVTNILLALLGLTLAFSIHIFLNQRAIAIQAPATQLVCASTPNFSPEKLSTQGRVSYEQGRFDAAIDCWQRATTAYSQAGNATESINNRINLAQAEQALGLYPRACNTLVKIYNQQYDCSNLLQLKEQNKRQELFDTFNKQADSPAKITALRSLGNILRGLGELELSNQVLLISLDKSPEQAANWLDIGNTRRALSNKEQDLYNRSQDSQHLVCAIMDTFAAESAYKRVIDDTSSNSNSISAIKLQAQLNQLSLLLDLQDWHNNRINQKNNKDNVIERLFTRKRLVQYLAEKKCFNEQLISWNEQLNTKLSNDITDILNRNNYDYFKQQLVNQNISTKLQEIDNIKQQINKIPSGHSTLNARLNLVQSWMRLNQDSQYENEIKEFLTETLNQAEKQGNKIAQSYALGYIGKLYKNSNKLQLAITTTQNALYLAQSIPAPDIVYQWQWQLGRIYKSQLPSRNKVQTKELKNDINVLNEARAAYDGTFQTLESLRRELATSSPDTQISFQKDVDGIYREYVDLLLRDKKPQVEDLEKAREVISSLQAAELENFLRQACPEYNLNDIDSIIDEQTQKTAFISPIILDDRIEVIIKLPSDLNNKNAKKEELEHYSKDINRDEFEKKIRQLQKDLEEEYTFEDVTKEANKVYNWLLKDAEKYLKNKEIDTLVFALDTTLQGIPLAALVYNITQDKQPQYLIEKYAIAIAPRLEIPKPTALQGKSIKILAAGLQTPQLVNQQRTFTELKNVTKELDALKEIEKNNSQVSVTRLEGDKFKTDNLQSNINSSTFQILHLATHGEFSSSPEDTFVLAYDKLIQVNELDKVFKRQAQNQEEPIELIVLSACETASGDKRATLGISGVAVRAGARSAIASLWALDDRKSVDFTKYFYGHLIKNTNETKAQALQKAQIEMKNTTGYEHPRYWDFIYFIRKLVVKLTAYS